MDFFVSLWEGAGDYTQFAIVAGLIIVLLYIVKRAADYFTILNDRVTRHNGNGNGNGHKLNNDTLNNRLEFQAKQLTEHTAEIAAIKSQIESVVKSAERTHERLDGVNGFLRALGDKLGVTYEAK